MTAAVACDLTIPSQWIPSPKGNALSVNESVPVEAASGEPTCYENLPDIHTIQ